MTQPLLSEFVLIFCVCNYMLILGKSSSGKSMIAKFFMKLLEGVQGWANNRLEGMGYSYRVKHLMKGSYSTASFMRQLAKRGGRACVLFDEQGSLSRMLELTRLFWASHLFFCVTPFCVTARSLVKFTLFCVTGESNSPFCVTARSLVKFVLFFV